MSIAQNLSGICSNGLFFRKFLSQHFRDLRFGNSEQKHVSKLWRTELISQAFAGALPSFGLSLVPSVITISFQVCMSFLRLIFFLAVVSLDLLAPSPILPHPRFSAYIFLFKVGMSLLKFIVCCFSRFAGALHIFCLSQVLSLHFLCKVGMSF